MNTDTVVIADSCCDLPYEYIKKRNVPIIYYTYMLNDTEYIDDFGHTMPYEDFFAAMRKGAVPTTSQVNVHVFADMFEKYVKEGKSIIYLSFSSGLTGSFNNALMARNMLIEKYENADITIIDTLSASIGEGLLVYNAVEMLHNGASKQEIIDWVEQNKWRINHWFTVDNLVYLKRGGRVSGAKAFVANVMDIKPVLNIDNEGHLIPIYKAKGRKKAMRTLISRMEELAVNPEEQVVAINHGDALDDALWVADKVKEKFNVKDIIINSVGPVIGSHSGPGTLSLFFFAEKRFINEK